MRTETIAVTPAMAEHWLERNHDNRPLRYHKVKEWARAIADGRWQLTHQGIAIDEAGNLLDGQHRLSAIVETGATVEMLVTFDAPRATFTQIDTTLPRSVRDVTGASMLVVGMVNVILRGSLNNATPSRESSLRGLAAMSDECNALLAFCGTARRGLTTAGARAAAVVQAYLTGDQTYPFMGYRNVVTQNFAELSRCQQAFLRGLTNATTRGDHFDIFARGLVAFDPAQADKPRIVIRDYDDAFATALRYVREHGITPRRQEGGRTTATRRAA
jgi:hypothetical protein